MIALFIFTLHVVLAAFAFAKGCVEHKLSEGFINVTFVAIIFSVAWTISGFVVKIALPPKGMGVWFDRDTMSLVFATILEAVLYFSYFHTKRKKKIESLKTEG
jgi:hypothetical protein